MSGRPKPDGQNSIRQVAIVCIVAAIADVTILALFAAYLWSIVD